MPSRNSPAMKATTGPPSPRSRAKPSKKSAVFTVGAMIGVSRSTCQSLVSDFERVEERDSLHGVAPLRPAGLGIYLEVSRPVNGGAKGVRHLGRAVESDFGAGEVQIGVHQWNGYSDGNDHVGYGGASSPALGLRADEHQRKLLPRRGGYKVEMRDGDDSVRCLASGRHSRRRRPAYRRRRALPAAELGARAQLVQLHVQFDELVELVLGLGAEFLVAGGVHRDREGQR